MKVFWCLIIYSYLFISCSSSQKISSSHTVHEEMNQKLHIDTLMVYRAIGSSKDANAKVSGALEVYLDDYFKQPYKDSFTELLHSLGIYQIPDEYSWLILNKIYEKTKIRYAILPKIKTASDGIRSFDAIHQSEAKLVIHYELYDLASKKLVMTALVSGTGIWTGAERMDNESKVEVLANTSRIDTRYIIAVPIESMMRPMALEATNELRKFLNIKHKYADLK